MISGQKIRWIRRMAELSQAELARMIGCSSSLVCKWENGRRRPDQVMLQRLMAKLHCTEQELTDRRN